MSRDFSRLRVDRVIVHDVPTRYSGHVTTEPVLSQVESPLGLQLRSYLQQKISGCLGAASFDVCFDPESTSPIPALVGKSLELSDRGFVERSQEMARHLYACQTGQNPAGLVLVAEGLLAQNQAMAILKLEKEDGVRVRTETVDGKLRLSIEAVRDLMLTERTKIFKLAAFVRETDEDGHPEVVGRVSDQQRGYHPSVEVAYFFLRRFLGCKLLEAPDITTKKFLTTTESFINERVDDPERQTDYLIALQAVMKDNSPVIRPVSFASTHLRSQDRQNFLAYLEECGVPEQQFAKDLSLVESHLTRIRLDFESGLLLVGRAESFGDHVTVQRLESSTSRVEITDNIKGIHSKS